MQHPFLAGVITPTVIAHRGLVTADMAKQGITENSRAAVAAALAVGSDIIETDCRQTRDGTVVLFHDALLTRTLGDEREISDIDVTELAELMADRGGLLTLKDALADFPSARFNIDIKVDEAVIPAGQLLAGYGDRVLVTSFSDKRRARVFAVATQGSEQPPAMSPGRNVLAKLVMLGVLRAGSRAAALLTGFAAIQVPEYQGRTRVLTKRIIKLAHRAGVAVHVWTVNDPQDMQRLVGMGVDGVVTDRADLALQVLRESRETYTPRW